MRPFKRDDGATGEGEVEDEERRKKGKGKGKARAGVDEDEKDEEERKGMGMFDEYLNVEERDTTRTTVLVSDKERFERSRVVAEVSVSTFRGVRMFIVYIRHADQARTSD